LPPSKKRGGPPDGARPPGKADHFLNNTDEVKASDANRSLAMAGGSIAQPATVTTVGHFLDLPKD